MHIDAPFDVEHLHNAVITEWWTLKNTQTTKELKEIEVWNHRPLNPLLNVYF